MTTHGSATKSARVTKEKHPEFYCPVTRCLWRTGDGSRCPKHGGEPKPSGEARLPVKGERVEYRAGFQSPVYRGVATGERCADGPSCTAVHVLADEGAVGGIHHVPADYFAAGEAHARWARVVEVPAVTGEGR